MRSAFSLLAIVALTWLQPDHAQAYTVKSGFTGGCHEEMTIALSSAFLDDPIVENVVVAGGDTWRKLAWELPGLVGRDLSDQQLFVLFSLVIGVRAPDTGGHSVSDLSAAREIAGDPRAETQYLHGLRGREDDEPDGSQSALEGTRASIRRSLGGAAAALERPVERQISTAPYTLDFYNRFGVPVWEPAYLLGEAAHTLQDSFAHSIRSDASDLKTVTYVLNYIDAISTHFVESRDGIAHSRYLDGCVDSDLVELFAAAQQATADLFDAFVRTQNGDEAAVDELLDTWLTLQGGCTLENDFCDNARWLAAARRDPTGTYLPGWMLCSSRSQGSGTIWLGLAGVLLLVGLTVRRFRTRSRSSIGPSV